MTERVFGVLDRGFALRRELQKNVVRFGDDSTNFRDRLVSLLPSLLPLPPWSRSNKTHKFQRRLLGAGATKGVLRWLERANLGGRARGGAVAAAVRRVDVDALARANGEMRRVADLNSARGACVVRGARADEAVNVVDAGRPISTRRRSAFVVQIEQFAAGTAVAGRALAGPRIELVDAGAAIAARIWRAIVDVVVAQKPIESGFAVASKRKRILTQTKPVDAGHRDTRADDVFQHA